MDDDEISESLSIILNALKHGPSKLLAVVAHLLKIIKEQKNQIEYLQNSDTKSQNQNKHSKVDESPISTETSNLSLPSFIQKKNLNLQKNDNPIPQNVTNVPKEEPSRKERHQKSDKLTKCSHSNPSLKQNTETSLSFPSISDSAPHPLTGCHCDVCQKLSKIPNIDIYKLESRNGPLFPPNCVLMLKNDHIATVAYLGHKRTYKGFIDSSFLSKKRPIGVTGYIWQLDNEESFFHLEDVKYAFDDQEFSLPPEVRPALVHSAKSDYTYKLGENHDCDRVFDEERQNRHAFHAGHHLRYLYSTKSDFTHNFGENRDYDRVFDDWQNHQFPAGHHLRKYRFGSSSLPRSLTGDTVSNPRPMKECEPEVSCCRRHSVPVVPQMALSHDSDSESPPRERYTKKTSLPKHADMVQDLSILLQKWNGRSKHNSFHQFSDTLDSAVGMEASSGSQSNAFTHFSFGKDNNFRRRSLPHTDTFPYMEQFSRDSCQPPNYYYERHDY